MQTNATSMSRSASRKNPLTVAFMVFWFIFGRFNTMTVAHPVSPNTDAAPGGRHARILLSSS